MNIRRIQRAGVRRTLCADQSWPTIWPGPWPRSQHIGIACHPRRVLVADRCLAQAVAHGCRLILDQVWGEGVEMIRFNAETVRCSAGNVKMLFNPIKGYSVGF